MSATCRSNASTRSAAAPRRSWAPSRRRPAAAASVRTRLAVEGSSAGGTTGTSSGGSGGGEGASPPTAGSSAGGVSGGTGFSGGTGSSGSSGSSGSVTVKPANGAGGLTATQTVGPMVEPAAERRAKPLGPGTETRPAAAVALVTKRAVTVAPSSPGVSASAAVSTTVKAPGAVEDDVADTPSRAVTARWRTVGIAAGRSQVTATWASGGIDAVAGIRRSTVRPTCPPGAVDGGVTDPTTNTLSAVSPQAKAISVSARSAAVEERTDERPIAARGRTTTTAAAPQRSRRAPRTLCPLGAPIGRTTSSTGDDPGPLPVCGMAPSTGRAEGHDPGLWTLPRCRRRGDGGPVGPSRSCGHPRGARHSEGSPP